jgi:FAD/FMN-containing dehydrogenase
VSIGNPAVGVDPAKLDELATSFLGDVIGTDHPEYEEARKVWNGMIDRRPALVLRCRDVADVIAAVNFARDGGFTVAVRCGGHNVAGNATVDGGVLIDLAPMRGVRVDPGQGYVDVQGGALLKDLDHALQAFGLAVPVGVVSQTGVSGLALGGGVGHIQRKHGLTVDNFISVDVVTADGQFLTASEDENEDLFWGLKGGGGNFGIATSFRFRTHPAGTVLAGPAYYMGDNAEILAQYFAACQDAPRELGTVALLVTAPPLDFIPAQAHGERIVALAACWCGDLAEGEKALEPFRKIDGLIADLIAPIPYAALQSMFDAAHPREIMNYWKTDILVNVDKSTAEALAGTFEDVKSPLSSVEIQNMGGAVRDVADEDTAYPNRDGDFTISVSGKWVDPAENEANIAWTRAMWDAMQPWSIGGGYVNYLDQEDDETVRRTYGEEKYARLTALKKKYDPDNFFRMNHNIPPE